MQCKTKQYFSTFVPFHKAFQKGRDTRQRGHILFCIPLVPPSRGQTSVTAKATEGGTAAPLCVSSAQRAPGSSGCGPDTSGQARVKEGTIHPLCLTTDSARHSSEVGLWRGETLGPCWRQEKAKRSAESQEIPNSWFWKRLSRHFTKALLLTYSAVQAPALSPFAAGYLSPISYCLLHYPFPRASYSTRSSSFPIPSTSCPLAPDLISASVPPILHPLPCSTLSPSLPLLIYPWAFLTPLSFLHPTSPTPQQQRSGEQRKTGGQDEHTTTQVR